MIEKAEPLSIELEVLSGPEAVYLEIEDSEVDTSSSVQVRLERVGTLGTSDS